MPGVIERFLVTACIVLLACGFLSHVGHILAAAIVAAGH